MQPLHHTHLEKSISERYARIELAYPVWKTGAVTFMAHTPQQLPATREYGRGVLVHHITQVTQVQPSNVASAMREVISLSILHRVVLPSFDKAVIPYTNPRAPTRTRTEDPPLKRRLL